MYRRTAQGFTLIELLITVVMVAILAAIAYPSYANFAFRTRRADGREFLMRLASSQERFYTNFNRYATTLAQLGVTAATSEKGYYTVAAPTIGAGGQTYRLIASPAGIQAPDSCNTLEVDNLGQKTAPNDMGTNGSCW